MTNSIIREHKHCIIRAYVEQPPINADSLSEWCKSVITSVNMKCIGGPLVVRSDMKDNAGFTAVAILDFSHLAIHTWDEISPALIEFDLFSCQTFNIDVVLDHLNIFKIKSYSTLMVDRDDFDTQQIPLLRVVA